jgi:imidazole glycerol-phosphate synthase subunit HisH
MLAIVDYGAGNLRSVAKALAQVGVEPTLVSGGRELLAADAVILPGVGAAGDAMRNLQQRDLVEPLREFVRSGRPLFGVCLGMQLILSLSDEDAGQPCLDIVAGRVLKLPDGLKVPHMGWNQVRQVREHPLFAGIPSDSYFYFVHSYYCAPADTAVVIGQTEYGVAFCSALATGNVVATQFHPEKSGEQGLQVYRNFLAFANLLPS